MSDYLIGQVAEAQSLQYYCSTQRHRSGHLSIQLCQRTKILTTEEKKVEKQKQLAHEIKKIHRGTRVTVKPIVIGTLGTISGNAKAWCGRLSLPNIFGNAQFPAKPDEMLSISLWCLSSYISSFQSLGLSQEGTFFTFGASDWERLAGF